MSIAELGRTIIRNNANMLWKKPFLHRFKDIPEEEEISIKKPYHKKARPEQIKRQKELNHKRSRVLWFKRLAAILISLVIIVSLYLYLAQYF